MQLILKKFNFSLLALGAVLALSSCVMDRFDADLAEDSRFDLLPDGTEVTIAFDIQEIGAGAGSTRAATDLVDGSDREHAIGESGNNVFFFDADGKLYEVAKLERDNEEDPDDGDNIEATYFTARIAKKRSQMPKSCIVVLNGNKVYRSVMPGGVFPDENVDVKDVLKVLWPSGGDPAEIGIDGYDADGYPYFTMSNSIYFGADGAEQAPVPITEANFCTEEELPLLKERAVKVRVERMVAKFTLQYDDAIATEPREYTPVEDEMVLFTGLDANGNHTYNLDYKWKARIVGWGMNALEKQSYLFKQVRSDGAYFADWNDPANFRSYWSVDPDYEATISYPMQYRRSVTEPSLKYYSKMEPDGDNRLRNYSFQHFVDAYNFGRPLYTPENTYDAAGLRSVLKTRTDVLAGTHLILCAHLLTNIYGTFEANNIYRDRVNVFYRTERECFQGQMMALYNEINTQRDMRFRYYSWNGTQDNPNGEILTARVAKSDKGKFTLWYNGKELNADALKALSLSSYSVKAEVTDGDGKRIMWIDGLSIQSNSTTVVEIYDQNGKKLRNANSNDMKSICLEWNGPVDHFVNGMMYYYAPAKIFTSGSSDFCGTVRNAWYVFSLKGVNKIGTPVDSETEEIVPNRVPVSDQLNFNTIMIDWHVIDRNANIL